MCNNDPFEPGFVPTNPWRVFYRENNGKGNWASDRLGSRSEAESYIASLPKKSKAYIDLTM